MSDENTAPPVLFAGGNKRWRDIDLEWPVIVGEKQISRITVRRMTSAEVIEWIENLDPGKMNIKRFPMFYDEAGERVSDAVMDSLDDDDGVRLVEAAADFLPRRFRVNSEPGSVPETGEPIAP